MMRRLLPILACSALASPALAQANRFGASPAEYRAASIKIAALENDFTGLSKRYGVPIATLRAIGRGQLRAAPSLGAGALRETIRKMAQDASDLKQQIAKLREQMALAGRLRGSSEAKTTSFNDGLNKASALLDAGDLEGAATILSQLEQQILSARTDGQRIWTDWAKATALVKYLAGDIAGFEKTLMNAKAGLPRDDVAFSWELEQERGQRLLLHGEALQDVALIERAGQVLQSEAMPLADNLDGLQQLQTLKDLCRARISPFAEIDVSVFRVERYLLELKKLVAVCGIAARLADMQANAPALWRAEAYVSYAYVNSIVFLLTGEEADKNDVDTYATRGSQIAQGTRMTDEAAAILVISGDVYASLSIVRKSREDLRRAISLYERALAHFDVEDSRAMWASAHQRIGTAYRVAYEASQHRGDLVEAKAHFERASTVFTPSFSPLASARNLSFLASVEGALGRLHHDRALVQASIVELRSAEQVLQTSLSGWVLARTVQTRMELEQWLNAKWQQ